MLTVVVWMVTYNHARYIRQAVESVMIQETSFDFKLLIGEDCSNDGTRDICHALKAKYPDKVELFLNKINIGATANGIRMYHKCIETNAKYVALLEGDDWWTNPTKLQRQVDFLENNLGYSGCCHNLSISYDSETAVEEHYSPINQEVDINIVDLIKSGVKCPIGTASLLFRNEILKTELDDDFNTLSFGDRPLECLLLKHGFIKYFPEVMGVYRKHGGGFTNKFNWITFEKDYERFYNYINRKLDYQYDLLISDQLKEIYLLSVHQLFAAKQFAEFKSTLSKLTPMLSTSDYLRITTMKLYLKVFLFRLNLYR